MDTNARKILYIRNPVAGKVRRRQKSLHLDALVAHPGDKITVVFTERNLPAHQIIRDRGQDADLIVCNGGDGTLSDAVSGTLDYAPQTPILYIPSGTTNDCARTLGLSADHKKITQLMQSGVPVPLDSGTLGGDRHITYSAAFGSFVSAAYSTPQYLKNRIGHSAYVITGARALATVKPYVVAVEANGQRFEGEYLFGFVSNATSIAGLLRIDPASVCLDDGLFELVLVRFPKKPSHLTRMLNALYHQQADGENVLRIVSDQFHFEFTEPVEWTVDGEYYGHPQAVDITIQPRSFRMLCPRELYDTSKMLLKNRP